MAGKEQENFCRNTILIVDHAKDSLVDVLELHLANNNILSFEDFINDHQHDIYHLCFNKRQCCQCPQGYVLPISRVLHPPQLEILLDKNGVPRSCHVHGKQAHSCHYLAKPGVTTNVLDITLARCLLINFCDDMFKKSCSLRKNIDTLLQMRNVYGHAKEVRITDDDYRIDKNEIESAILEIAKVCKNETGKKQILMDLEKRSLDGKLCIHYQNTLLGQIARETQIEEKLDDLAEKMKKLAKAVDDIPKQKLTKDAIVEVQPLQETSSLTSTPSSGNQSSQIENLFKDQINLHSQTMNQTNNIERNNLPVVTSGGLMRNSEPQNLYSSVNPTDHQAGAMMIYSPESSSNNLSRGNDQSGQGHQRSIETDAEPYNVNNDLEDKRDIYDGAVLHAEDDRDAAIQFIKNMERENPDLNITLYDNLFPGKPLFQSAAEVFDICRYLFVFVTQNFVKADSQRYLSEIATNATLTLKGNKDRLIPVLTDKTCDVATLTPIQPLKYYHYLEAIEKQKDPDYYFIKCFTKVIDDGRQEYLKKVVN